MSLNLRNLALITALFVGLSVDIAAATSPSGVGVTTPGSGTLVSGNLATATGPHTITDSGKAAPSGDIVGTTDTQTITNKTISGASNTLLTSGGLTHVANYTSDHTITNADCGGHISEGLFTLVFTIPDPSTLKPDCRVTLLMGPNKMWVSFSGAGMKWPGWTVNPITDFGLTPGVQWESLTIRSDGTDWWLDGGSLNLIERIVPRDTPIYTHGQFALKNYGSALHLDPHHGPGGIMTNGRMMWVPDGGISIPNSALALGRDYIYAFSQPDGSGSDGQVSGAGDNGAGLIRLNIVVNAVAGSQVALACVSIRGATKANGVWLGTVVTSGSSGVIDLIGSSSSGLGTYTGGGNCRLLELIPSTTGHTVVANGIDSEGGGLPDPHYTLVGWADVTGLGPSNVQSWSSTDDEQYLINLASVDPPLPPQSGTGLHVNGSDAVSPRVQVTGYGAQAFITTARADGTNASPSAVTSGEQIGGFQSCAYNGTTFTCPGASVRAYAEENQSSGHAGSKICLATVPNGSITMADSLCQHNDGGVTIGGSLTTSGHVVSSGTAFSCSDLSFGTGAGTSPSCTSVAGDDRQSVVTIHTGTSPASDTTIFTLTFKSAYASAAPNCIMGAGNSSAATKYTSVWPTSTTSTIVLNVGISALSASTTYVFNFQCIG